MRILYSSLVLVGLVTTGAFAFGDSPLKTVQQFKQALDANNAAALCRLMAEEDGSGPLKLVHYEQMQRSIEGLVTLWRGVPFTYGTESATTSRQNQATIKVEVPSLSQEVKFILLKFGNEWYIFDMEIYFKK
jgi:hypothetical protein